MPPAGFAPTIPANEGPQTYVLESKATGIEYWTPHKFLKIHILKLHKTLNKSDEENGDAEHML